MEKEKIKLTRTEIEVARTAGVILCGITIFGSVFLTGPILRWLGYESVPFWAIAVVIVFFATGISVSKALMRAGQDQD